MKIKPLEWTEYTNTETQILTYMTDFIELGTEYCLGFEIIRTHSKYRLILQNYNNLTDYHPLGLHNTLTDAKEYAQEYAEDEIEKIVERFVE